MLAAGLVSCAVPVHQAEAAAPVPAPSAGNVEIGNSTYIPINQDGTLESNIEVVFAAVDKWEKAHPDKEIVDIDYVHRQRGYAIGAYTYGVIIYSRSR
jgi:hypothetical protein